MCIRDRLLHIMRAPFILNPKTSFVMDAIDDREKKHLYTASKNIKFFVNKPPKELFVNNYSQKEKPLGKKKKKIGETVKRRHQDLPPQPVGYLKFPKYDWF